jgi:hypothetical protein
MTVRHPAVRLALVLACLGWLTGCSSPVNPSLIGGNWTGVVRPSHSDILDIRFTDGGDGRLVGVACRFDSNTKIMKFNDLPVTIDGRTVTVAEFSGKFPGNGLTTGFQLRSSLNDKVYADLVRGGNYCGQD